ncbi:MAG: hypothetical protein AAGF29_01125 [Pseudomonadota bacterium]
MKTASAGAAKETSSLKETMTTPDDALTNKTNPKQPNEQAARREARLKQALRDNLMRRKAKARATKAQPPSSDNS